ncbi:hypothetical protein MRB53_005674 [Persea americana]|uniref:Uncharacterized protein n=1 Tax=Persea americana TaxID=3435 RepID=A0ACC2MEX1_PERAE|nr:hypothetical protein MRB53_005674 [Persea americana]
MKSQRSYTEETEAADLGNTEHNFPGLCPVVVVCDHLFYLEESANVDRSQGSRHQSEDADSDHHQSEDEKSQDRD